MVTSAVPFSGGTSLEGNFAAPFGGMSIDFTHMDKVLDFHEAEYAHRTSVLTTAYTAH